jgi:ABC-2 type transport system ATP-binding protein
VITVEHLTKRYGDILAVDDLSFSLQPGIVTGFLGPNGAGKSTTMRMILGLDRPTSGTATIGGQPFAESPWPLRKVGALLDAMAMNKNLSNRANLRILASTNRIPTSRVDEVLEIVGLTKAANRKTGASSLGMGQRMGIAAALLGDPEVIILDEPVNGLDPDGVLWIRSLMRNLAAEGRTVFLSSHLMSEMEMTADHLIIIGKGKLLADMALDAFLKEESHGGQVTVRTHDATKLAELVATAGGHIEATEPSTFVVTKLSAEAIGKLAADNGIALIELHEEVLTLEQAYFTLTSGQAQWVGEQPAESTGSAR